MKYDQLFVTYANLDPPPVRRKTDLSKQEIPEDILDDVIDYPDITSEESEEIEESEETPIMFSASEDSSFKDEVEKNHQTLKGSASFEEAFAEAERINPDITKYKNFLVKTARRESGFNSHIQNTQGAPYYGYFQMGKNEIAMTTRMSVEQFRNNPVAQILGACKLYEMNLNAIKRLGVYDLGRRKGYSDDALVSGAWMGGPGGVKKYLLGLGDPSDSHWYDGNGGSSVGKIMNNWKRNEHSSKR